MAALAPAAGKVAPLRAVAALAVLHRWDRLRAQAWARGDVDALARLYATAGAARADVANLRRWTARGLRVEGMEMQVERVLLEHVGPRRIVLVVTDRLVAARAVGANGVTDLPRDRPTTRRLTVVRDDAGRWLVADAVETPEVAG